MLYQITAPPAAAPDKQADELLRLLKHSKNLTIQFVTVAGSYKPSRARLVVFSTPDRFAEQAARVITAITGREDATRQSQAVKIRPEWKHVALLVPTDPDAPAIDGMLLDGWDSAFLSFTYRPGRVMGRLMHCAEDSERVAAFSLDGWQLIAKPNPLQLIANAAGRPWNGVASITPVPGGIAAAPQRTAAAEREVPATIEAPAPIHQEIKAALTESADGFLLGVTPEGNAVRLARRAMTLAVNGPQEARQRAVLALLRRGMQAGMGMIVIVDRALLPTEALQAWEARVRLLDVQNITDSCAIPWREIAPDLLAQAIGGPLASLTALPSRFGAVLDTLGAESLRVPAVLGLATMPGDNLRGALAAGGLVVVPQDGDAASTIVARLLMAYLATPPAIGRGLLVLLDPAIVPPEALRQQALQVVAGERSDALLRLGATDSGWKLCGPDGSPVAELLPDLMTQPTEGAGDMVDSIVRDIGTQSSDVPALAAAEEVQTDESASWWAGGARSDDLHKEDEPAHEQPAVGIGIAAIEDVPAADMVADVPASDLDRVLGSLLNALLDDEPANVTEELIQAAVASEDFAMADTAALTWSAEAPQIAQPWSWRVVLAEEDADRAVAAWRAILAAPNGRHVALLRAVRDAMDALEPAAWLARIGDEMPAEPIDEEIQIDDLSTAAGLVFEGDEARLRVAADLPNPADWPITFAELPALAGERDERAPLPAQRWELREVARIADHALADAVQAEIAPIVVAEEQRKADTPVVPLGIFESPVAPVVEPAVAVAMHTAAPVDLSDDAIRAIWQGGESVPQLVARLVASGVDAPAARARVRAIVNARPSMSAVTMPATLIQTPPIPVALGLSPQLPAMNVTPLLSEPVASVDQHSTAPADSMIGSAMPAMQGGEIDDAGIWQLWQAGTKTDDISIAICGKRGGPKADAARDRIYSVVIPRIVAALDCDDLVDRIVAGEPATTDPRYSELMKRLARSENAPVGNLERSLIKRLLSARQEV